MRVATALAVLLFASSASGDECPEPTDFISLGFLSWERHSTVYYQFEQSTTDTMRAAARHAFNRWTSELEGPTKLNVKFVEANTMHEPHLRIHGGSLPTGTYARFRPENFRSDTKNLISGQITVDQTQYMQGPGDIHAGLEKGFLHEIGHSLGLDHPLDQEAEASIMNQPVIGDPNDTTKLLSRSPTNCDKNKVHQFNKVTNDSSNGGGGRTKPPNMPGHLCNRCGFYRYEVWDEDVEAWREHEVEVWCCGHNAFNANPRPPGGPSFAFFATGYHCSHDGWVQTPNRGCYADLCCVHPDDVPLGSSGGGVPGTTCAAQGAGWFEHDKRGDCQRSIGFAEDDVNGCVKKEVCGPGPCQPWPFYCWKAPFVPGGGGGGGDDDGDDPPPNGVTCSSKGWWNGDDLGGCEGVHGVNGCERKQSCDGQQCLPDPPGYCWQPK